MPEPKLDPKSTWPVVKFLIAATGFRRKEARTLLNEIPRDKYAELFIKAMAWDRDTDGQASRALEQILGGMNVHTLQAATNQARLPSTAQEEDDDDAEPTPRKQTGPRAAAR